MSILKVKDKHKFYDFVTTVFNKSQFNWYVLKTLASRFESSFCNRYFNFFLIVVDVFYITFKCYLNFNRNLIFIREFNTIPFLVNSVILFPIKSRIFLNVNHNFQRACSSRFHRFGIKFLDFLGYNFFCFEDSALCFSLKTKCIEIPFPITCNYKLDRATKKKITVGVVGSVRPEKNIDELLFEIERIKCFFPEVDFLLGSDDPVLNSKFKSKNWLVSDTSVYEDYLNALNITDIIVFNYNANSYMFRHSGVITDAIVNNKIVVVPEYPYFVKQINNPVPVGVSFSSLNVLRGSIQKSILLFESGNMTSLYANYFEYRNIDRVVSILDAQIGPGGEK